MRWSKGRIAFIALVLFCLIFTASFMKTQFGQFFKEMLRKGSTYPKHRLASFGECPEDFSDWNGNYVFITVKTTAPNHGSRLRLLMQTWIPTALALRGKNNESLVKVSLVSDQVDPLHSAIVGGRMVKSQCKSSHNNWYCHFDDDNYVNIYKLLKELRKRKPAEAVYIGKSSRGKTKLRDTLSILPMPLWGRAPAQFVTFTFATGGAGFCLSQAAMQKIKFKVSRVYGGRGLEGLCLKMEGLADDVAVGYINGYYNVSLTEVPQFHSHLERLPAMSTAEIKEAITLSYTKWKNYENTVSLPEEEVLAKTADQTRFLSVHKFLSPVC